jgi:hypothetical protein
MRRVILPVTTDASGDGSYTGEAVLGSVYAVQLVDGTFDDGVDITITSQQGDLNVPLFVKADFNTDTMIYPRVLQQLATDGTNLTTHAEPLAVGPLKAVVAQGGNVKSGTFIIYIREI